MYNTIVSYCTCVIFDEEKNHCTLIDVVKSESPSHRAYVVRPTEEYTPCYPRVCEKNLLKTFWKGLPENVPRAFTHRVYTRIKYENSEQRYCGTAGRYIYYNIFQPPRQRSFVCYTSMICIIASDSRDSTYRGRFFERFPPWSQYVLTHVHAIPITPPLCRNQFLLPAVTLYNINRLSTVHTHTHTYASVHTQGRWNMTCVYRI